jgi:hypothetical protein
MRQGINVKEDERASRPPSGRRATTMPVTTKLKAAAGDTKAVHIEDDDGQAVAIWNLSVLIIPDGKFWFAQGLEINYGAQGDSEEDAKSNFQAGLLDTICLHLRVHGHIEKLLEFAPSRVLVEAAKNKTLIKRFGQVSFHDIADSKVQEALPFSGIDYRVLRQVA